jgi:hypothetical protein
VTSPRRTALTPRRWQHLTSGPGQVDADLTHGPSLTPISRRRHGPAMQTRHALHAGGYLMPRRSYKRGDDRFAVALSCLFTLDYPPCAHAAAQLEPGPAPEFPPDGQSLRRLRRKFDLRSRYHRPRLPLLCVRPEVPATAGVPGRVAAVGFGRPAVTIPGPATRAYAAIARNRDLGRGPPVCSARSSSSILRPQPRARRNLSRILPLDCESNQCTFRPPMQGQYFPAPARTDLLSAQFCDKVTMR